MPDFIDMPIDDTDSIKVEVTRQAVGLVRAGRASDTIDRTEQRLDDAVARLNRMGAQVLAKVRGSAKPPTTVQVEVGLKLTAKAGFVVAESTGEAHFIVRLEWANPQ